CFGGLRFCQLHLPEHGAGDQKRRHAADLAADMFPVPPLLAFDAEHFLGEFGSRHGRSPSLPAVLRNRRTRQLPCHGRLVYAGPGRATETSVMAWMSIWTRLPADQP